MAARPAVDPAEPNPGPQPDQAPRTAENPCDYGAFIPKYYSPKGVFGRHRRVKAIAQLLPGRSRTSRLMSMKAILSTAMVVVIATTASSQSFSGGGPGAPPVVILEEVPDQTYAAILATLREQGYEIVSISNTWLNRVRITARNTSHVREIVLSRATGQILRDALIE